TWTMMNETGAPTAFNYTAVPAGNKFIVWGGSDNVWPALNSGAVYDLESDTWTATSVVNNFSMPSGRYSHAACWTGTEMLIWGGLHSVHEPYADTFSYTPARKFYLYLKQ